MFKPGDRVICVDNNCIEDRLTMNNTYIVIKIDKNDISEMVQVIDNRCSKFMFYIRRFKLDIKQERKEKLKKICSI